jgi:hypothetical protein
MSDRGATGRDSAERKIRMLSGPIGKMIIAISIIAGAIAIIIVASVAYIAVTGGIVPEVLVNWGGVIIGFFFGQFFGLIKDLVGIGQSDGS